MRARSCVHQEQGRGGIETDLGDLPAVASAQELAGGEVLEIGDLTPRELFGGAVCSLFSSAPPSRARPMGSDALGSPQFPLIGREDQACPGRAKAHLVAFRSARFRRRCGTGPTARVPMISLATDSLIVPMPYRAGVTSVGAT